MLPTSALRCLAASAALPACPGESLEEKAESLQPHSRQHAEREGKGRGGMERQRERERERKRERGSAERVGAEQIETGALNGHVLCTDSPPRLCVCVCLPACLRECVCVCALEWRSVHV